MWTVTFAAEVIVCAAKRDTDYCVVNWSRQDAACPIRGVTPRFSVATTIPRDGNRGGDGHAE